MHSIFSSYKEGGISIFWDDENLKIEPYNKIKKVYYCGRELLKFNTSKTVIYTILVIDLDECYCADVYSDGEIKKRFAEHSEVPHKHKCGGQSAARFQRIRDSEITLWFKRINEYLKRVNGDIDLGISFVYKARFLSKLSTYNKAKIRMIRKTEYSGLTGIYDQINKIEAEKGNIPSVA